MEAKIIARSKLTGAFYNLKNGVVDVNVRSKITTPPNPANLIVHHELKYFTLYKTVQLTASANA